MNICAEVYLSEVCFCGVLLFKTKECAKVIVQGECEVKLHKKDVRLAAICGMPSKVPSHISCCGVTGPQVETGVSA